MDQVVSLLLGPDRPGVAIFQLDTVVELFSLALQAQHSNCTSAFILFEVS